MGSTRTIPTVALMALVALVAVAACEGEPPKTAAGAAQPVPPPPASTETAEPEEPARPACAPPAAPGNTCPCCPCAAGDAGAEAGDGGAAVTPPPQVIAPPTPTSFMIKGTLTAASKPLAYAVVYLEDAPIEANAKMTAVINNQQMAFSPFLTVIPAGGKVTFSNSDPFPHNVFSPDAEKFNMGTISQHQGMVHTFPKPGAYSLLCNLHPGMLGYLVVTPSSYFGKTDAKGRYAIKAVPSGTYKATAWAPRLATATQSVVVKDGDATLDFELHR